jgi:hypothetical protein
MAELSKPMQRALAAMKAGRSVDTTHLLPMERRAVLLLSVNQEEAGQPIYFDLRGGPRLMIDAEGRVHVMQCDGTFERLGDENAG